MSSVKHQDVLLVSAGTELIFSLVAGTVLCFGFRLRTMLVTHRCFSCCSVALTLIKDFSVSHALPVRRVTRSQEEAETGHLTQTSQRDIPYHSTSCLAYKLDVVTPKGLITARVGLGIGQWVGNNCIGHHLCLLVLGFFFTFSVLYSLPLLFPLVVVSYCTLVIKLCLSQPVGFTFF